jgi:sensor histidine kinase YesM
MFKRINAWLDRYILPWPVRFLTHRFVILATMLLLVPLIVFSRRTVLVLGLNSYLNTMSVAVSSIVLLYATISEIQQKRIAEMQEKRAQEEHNHVTQMHTLMLETLANQHQEIEELKEMLAATQGQAYQGKPRPEIANLRGLHPRGDARFEPEDLHRQLSDLHITSHPEVK